MNFEHSYTHGFDYCNGVHRGAFEPLSIVPVQQSQTSMWSPFSTPSFSPYAAQLTPGQLSQSSFQYSAKFYSPDPNRSSRAIYKSVRAQHQQQHQQPWSGGDFKQPTVGSSNTTATTACDYAKRSLPKRSEQIDMSEYIRQAAVQRSMSGRVKMCTFCRSNGETEVVYTSHALKDSFDKITCPILMRYACPFCGATGESSHTINYCPVLQKKKRFEKLKNLTNTTGNFNS